MKLVTTALGAAVMMAALAAPAAADFVRLGSVDVGYRTDSDTAYTRFAGRLESLRLIASRSDILCRSVIVRYENGDVQNVFSGRLDERRPVDVDLRGRARRVDSIHFVCRSDTFHGGQIFVEGEVGHFRDEWRGDHSLSALFGADHGGDHDRMGDRDHMGSSDRMSGPDRMGDHDRMGDRDHMGGPDRGGDRDWVVLGQQSFEGSNDKESTFADWNGRHVDRIALRPLETDAQCMNIVATYDGGRKVKLADGRTLERGRVAVYDLPGDQHNLSKVFLRCRSVSGYRVTIEILAHR
ncbi:MAG: hypothetical protein P4L57_16720 [Rhizomicrobium sp.]|nr:hypothetical protein [Rhizomicrobium sp.]